MRVTKRGIRGAQIVEVHGKLIGSGENSKSFHDCIKSLLDEGKNKVVVDLKHTSWANSQGIGILIGAFTSVKNAGGELVLTHAPNRIKDILNVTRLFLIFKNFESENEAIDYLIEGAGGNQDINFASRLRHNEELPPTRLH